jgi:hypothetical protein
LRRRFVWSESFVFELHFARPDLALEFTTQFEPRGAMVSTVNIELPPVDACGVRTVTNPFAPGVTMVAGDLKSRAHRLGLRKTSQIRCPVTGLVLEPRGNHVRVNMDKQAQAYARSRKVYVRSRAELTIQSVRRTQLFTERTNEKRVPLGPQHNTDPFE